MSGGLVRDRPVPSMAYVMVDKGKEAHFEMVLGCAYLRQQLTLLENSVDNSTMSNPGYASVETNIL